MAFFRFLGKIVLFPVWLALLCIQVPLMFATCLGGGLWRTCIVLLGIFDLISTIAGPQAFWIFLISIPFLVLAWFVPTLLDFVAGGAKAARMFISHYWHTPCTERCFAGPYERASKAKKSYNAPDSQDTQNSLEATRLMKERDAKRQQNAEREEQLKKMQRVANMLCYMQDHYPDYGKKQDEG